MEGTKVVEIRREDVMFPEDLPDGEYFGTVEVSCRYCGETFRVDNDCAAFFRDGEACCRKQTFGT
jgi:hypothetical protein